MKAMLMAKRRKAGLSQKQLAERLGVASQTVSEWERGKRLPTITPHQTLTLCQSLGIDLEELVNFLNEE